MAKREDDTGAATLRTAGFSAAREFGAALFDLLSDTAVANVGISADDVVYVLAPDGTVCRHARLVRERLSDGSFVFNVALG